jgi:pyruvate/2-oxoglutarate dehydrogenase complex dihydrolipoamide acyltransferase (E2) component
VSTGTQVEVVMPQMGVSVSEGTITRWLKQAGDNVALDEPLLEISTDKVDTEVPSPANGVLQQILVAVGRARTRVSHGIAGEQRLVEIAEPREVGELVEVAREVRPPVAETDLSDARRFHRHNFQTFPFAEPFLPVAFRKSTTIFASSTSLS